jgi:large subunit ribosomal protein L47
MFATILAHIPPRLGRFLSTALEEVHTKAHRLHEFFEDNQALPKFNPENRIIYGRAWRTEELKQKSFEDLHCLWFVLLKERNLLATQEAEARRRNVTWYGIHRDFKCRSSMARIKSLLAQRVRLFGEASLASRRLSMSGSVEEGELWVQWDEKNKEKIYRARPWYRQRQRFLRRIHPMF